MYNPKEVEERTLKLWKQKGVPEKVLKFRKGKKKFYFLDGPPYATGEIHLGTALNKILKDFYIRFFRMNGFDVWAQPGYDTHGLPIENKVEKQLGFKNKKDIESFGIAKFVEECRKFATQFIGVMNDQFNNLGIWMDWKNPYLTLNPEYIEGAWFTFKTAFEKGLLYKGDYPVHVCPRCGTAVAYNEIEYKNITENSIYVKFPVLNKKNEFFLIWTTTPWTLPANVGVMVNPKVDYSKVRVGSEDLWIAKYLVDKVMKKLEVEVYEVLQTVPGKKLEGTKYENPMKDILPLQKKIIGRVVLSEQYVSLEDGTGLVHTAPGHGKEDFKVGRENKLPVLSPLKTDGTFTEEAGFLKGKYAKDADVEIIKELKKRNAIFGEENITHDYPLCWRCDTPLLLMSVPQWFFKISSLRNKLLTENKKMNWTPDWAGKRFENWLQSLDDWPISRQRYWGIPLPIWICDHCEHVKVVESVKELPKKPKDLHRPYIDEVTWKCKKCGKGTMRRVPDVIDVWFDAGVSAWASLGFPSNKTLFKKMWPVDFVLEGPDQIRGWWNSSLITSVITFDERPFKNILFHGFILDAHGRKMSKSLGNIIAPQDVIDKYGRDIFRYYFLKYDVSNDFSFDWESVKDAAKFFNVLYNSFNFFETYCKKTKSLKNLKTEDKWILSRVNSVVEECRKANESFNHVKAVGLFENFIVEDLSHWYIKIIRERTWPTHKGKDKLVAFATLYYVLDRVLKMFAPLCPYLSEDIYQKLFKSKETIHMEDYPSVDKKFVDKGLEESMKMVKRIVEVSNSIRHDTNIKLKYPLRTLIVESKKKINPSLKSVIEQMANVKIVKFGKVKEGLDFEYGKVFVDTEVTKELKIEWLVKELIRAVQDKRKQMNLKVTDKIKLYIPPERAYKSWAKVIGGRTGSKVTFGELKGEKVEFKFENDVYWFGVQK